MGSRNMSSSFMSSAYLGVKKQKMAGKYVVYFFEKVTENGGCKSKRVYLGSFENEEMAARAYDLMTFKYKGSEAPTNFPITAYEKELKEMQNMCRQECINFLRRASGSFSKGSSVYRGVSRDGRKWRAMIRTFGDKNGLYLGLFETEEEAAEAYDIAAISYKGISAVTNFEKKRYDVEAIMKSNLPLKRKEHWSNFPLKRKEQSTSTASAVQDSDTDSSKIGRILKDETNAENNMKKSFFVTAGNTVSTINHSIEEPIHASPEMASSLQYPEATHSTPVMFNIWSDLRI